MVLLGEPGLRVRYITNNFLSHLLRKAGIMNLRSSAKLMLLVIAVLLCVGVLSAQEARYGLTVMDNGAEVTKIFWGVGVGATYCADVAYSESELPPFPPGGVLEARFIDHRTGVGACLGEGQGTHMQAEAPSSVDTFQIKYQPGSGGFPMTLTWLGPLGSNFTSCRMVDLFGGILVNVDMLTNSNAVITNGAITQLMIIATRSSSALTPTGVKLESSLIPGEFALKQNYPNPFNPSTTINFQIEKSVFTEVAVFDINGRKVSTLASGQMNPGYYSVTWDGRSDVGTTSASGVYYVRMSARGEGTDFSSVRKLLLMK